jgi:hypothetical protein
MAPVRRRPGRAPSDQHHLRLEPADYRRHNHQSEQHDVAPHDSLPSQLRLPAARYRHHDRNSRPKHGTSPRDNAAAAGLSTWGTFPKPSRDYPEQVFLHTLDPAGAGRIRIYNPTLRLAATVTVDPAVLPWAFQFRSAAAHAYALAIEPANCPTVDGRAAARAAGSLPTLEPGDFRSYRVELSIDTG